MLQVHCWDSHYKVCLSVWWVSLGVKVRPSLWCAVAWPRLFIRQVTISSYLYIVPGLSTVQALQGAEVRLLEPFTELEVTSTHAMEQHCTGHNVCRLLFLITMLELFYQI